MKFKNSCLYVDANNVTLYDIGKQMSRAMTWFVLDLIDVNTGVSNMASEVVYHEHSCTYL